jgi:hypothetical protein
MIAARTLGPSISYAWWNVMRGSGLVCLRIGLLRETQSHRTIATPNQPKLANKFQHDHTTQGARPMKPLMDSMSRPGRYGAPPKIRRLVPSSKMLRTSRCLTGLTKRLKFE